MPKPRGETVSASAGLEVQFIDIPDAERTAIRDRLNAHAAQEPFAHSTVVIFQGDVSAALEAAAQAHCGAVLEWGTSHSAQSSALTALKRCSDPSHLLIWVTSPTAYAVPLVQLAGARIADSFNLTKDVAQTVDTVLGECLPNAIIHGNLGLQSPNYQNIDDFVAFQEKIEKNLKDPVLGQRGVCLVARLCRDDEAGTICLTVVDEGVGFVPSSGGQGQPIEASLEASLEASGRGLGIVRTVAADLQFHDQGRVVDVFIDDDTSMEDDRARLTQARPVAAQGSERAGEIASMINARTGDALTPGSASVGPPLPSAMVGNGVESFDAEVDDIQVIAEAMPRAKILVADDDELMQAFLRIHLENAGYLNLIFASDGAHAWELVQSESPDFCILDVEMPGLSGFEVTERIRAHSVLHKVPVIIASAHTSSEFRNQALASGASDVLSKPVDPDLLADRVQLHLQNKMLMEGLESYRARLRQELDAARRMLESLLPDEATSLSMKAEYGVELQTVFQPSSELGGDWWGVQAIDDERFAIFIVDFTGHGVGPCINIFRLHTLMTTGVVRPGRVTPASLLEWLNAQLHRLLPRGQFATMFYGVVNQTAGTLTYSAAGSTEPFLGNVRGDLPKVLPSAGIPLGLAADVDYDEHVVEFGSGDYLLLYSDALIETPNEAGEVLSNDHVISLLSDAISGPVYGGEMVRLFTEFKDWAAASPDDDLTMLLLCG